MQFLTSAAACAVHMNAKLFLTAYNTAHISLRNYVPNSKFAFVADTNLFSDAHLVSVAAVGYKPESAFATPGCCGFSSHETTTSWGEIMP